MGLCKILGNLAWKYKAVWVFPELRGHFDKGLAASHLGRSAGLSPNTGALVKRALSGCIRGASLPVVCNPSAAEACGGYRLQLSAFSSSCSQLGFCRTTTEKHSRQRHTSSAASFKYGPKDYYKASCPSSHQK